MKSSLQRKKRKNSSENSNYFIDGFGEFLKIMKVYGVRIKIESQKLFFVINF